MFFYSARRKLFRLAASLMTWSFFGGCCAPLPPSDYAPPEEIIYYECEIVTVYPHDSGAFTQGLVFENGCLYEGTGMHGKSSIRQVALESGEPIRQYLLSSSYFGEGIAVQGKRLFQLTWRSNVGFVYDLDNFEQTGDFGYLGEGWGLTHDGKRLIMSDGTSRLRFLDMNSFEEKGSIHVRYGSSPIQKLNELEYINGMVYANIWYDHRIAIICPESGYVTGWIDCSSLLKRPEIARADVLNGIAWDRDGERLFVTGKYWPELFEIRLIEKARAPYPAVE